MTLHNISIIELHYGTLNLKDYTGFIVYRYTSVCSLKIIGISKENYIMFTQQGMHELFLM